MSRRKSSLLLTHPLKTIWQHLRHRYRVNRHRPMMTIQFEPMESRVLFSVAAAVAFDLALPNGTNLNDIPVSATGLTGNYVVSQTVSGNSYGSSTYLGGGLDFAGDPNVTPSTGAALISATSGTSNSQSHVQQLKGTISANLTGTVYLSYEVFFQGASSGIASSNGGYTAVSLKAGGLNTAINTWNNWANSVAVGYGGLSAGTNLNLQAGKPYMVVARFTNVASALTEQNPGVANLWVLDQNAHHQWSIHGASETTLGDYAIATATSTATSGTYTLAGTLSNTVNSGGFANNTINQAIDGIKAGTQLTDVLGTAWVATLPNAMNAQDVGSPAIAGESVFTDGQWHITGAGSDIGSTADQFQFAMTDTQGDGSIIAHLLSQTNTHASAKAGIMARTDSADGAVNAAVFMTPENGLVFQYRNTSNGTTQSTQITGVTGPVYLKLSHAGTSWSAYYSTDGQTYTQIGSAVTLNGLGDQTYQAGLAVSSHNTAQASTAIFDQFATPLNLITNGTVNYQIHLAQNTDSAIDRAVTELNTYLAQIGGGSGASIVRDFAATSGPQIIIGRLSQLTDILTPDIDYEALGSQGFVVQTVGSNIVIAGATSGGTQYGVNWFLDHVMGVHWLSPTYTYVPNAPDFTVNSVNTMQVPALEFRQVLGMEGQNKTFAWHNLLNGNTHGAAGWSIPTGTANWDTSWGMAYLEESYADLVPGQYMYGGQLLMMNPGTAQAMANVIISQLQNRPNYQNEYFTVMANDWGWSMDTESAAFAAQHGGTPAAPQLYMMTQVLNLVRATLPGAKIAYNVYQWSFNPPTGMTVPEGLMIIPMDIHLDQSTPFNEEYNIKIGQSISQWNDIAQDLILWDHTTNFNGFIMPTPNLYSVAENIRWLTTLDNYHGYFAEDAHFTASADFASLRTWLIARMTWDPTTDISDAMSTWCNEYYGTSAGPLVKQYIDLTQAYSDSTGSPAWEKHAVTNAMYTLDYVMQADSLFEQAAAAVAGDATLLKHVNQARASVDFVILARRAEYAYLASQQSLTFDIDFANRLARLNQAITDNGITSHAQGLSIADMNTMLAVERTYPAAAPSIVSSLPDSHWIDFQDHALQRYGDLNNAMVADALASDGAASRLYSGKRIHLKLENLPDDGSKYEFYAAVRVTTSASATDTTVALTQGKENAPGNYSANVTVGQLTTGQYSWVKIGSGPYSYMNSDQAEVYLNASTSSAITGVYVDRIVAVRIPDAPQNIAAQTNSYSQIDLAWDAVVGATSYNVYRSLTSDGQGSTPIASGITGTTFSDMGLSPDTAYYYKITAQNIAGISVKSTQATADTTTASMLAHIGFDYWALADGASIADKPIVPIGDENDYGMQGSLVVTATSHTGSSGSAQYNASGLTFGSNFHVTDGGAITLMAKSGTVNGSPHNEKITASINANPTGTVYMSYLVSFDGSTWRTDNNGYTNVTLSAGDLKTAFNVFGNYANRVAVGYGALTAGTVLNPTLNTTYILLTRHTNVGVALSATTTGQADLWVMDQQAYDNWVAAGAVENDLGNFALATASSTATTGTYQLSGTFSNSINSGSYAYTQIKQTLDEIRIGATLADVTTSLLVPSGLSATATSSRQIDLAWHAVDGATSYNVYRSTTSGGQGGTPIATGLSSPSFSDQSLNASTTYYYTVAALNGTTVGTPSAEISTATQQAAISINLPFAYPAISDGASLSGISVIPTGDVTTLGFSGQFSLVSSSHTGSVGSVTYASDGLDFGSNYFTGEGGAAVVYAKTGPTNGTPQVESLKATLNTDTTGTVYMGYLLSFDGSNWRTDNNGYTQVSLQAGGLNSALNMFGSYANRVGVGYGSLVSGDVFNPSNDTTYMVMSRYTHVGDELTAANPGVADLWVFDQTNYDNWFNAGALEMNLGLYALAGATATKSSGTYNLAGEFVSKVNSGNFANTTIAQTLDGLRVGSTLADIITPYNPAYLNFNDVNLAYYSSADQGTGGQVAISDGGYTLQIQGNGWRKVALPYTFTTNTVIEFDFKSTVQGEIHGIGFDVDDAQDSGSLFKLFGTQSYGIQTYNTYSGSGWQHFTIEAGQNWNGLRNYLTFANDDDASNAGVSLFRNLRIFEA